MKLMTAIWVLSTFIFISSTEGGDTSADAVEFHGLNSKVDGSHINLSSRGDDGLHPKYLTFTASIIKSNTVERKFDAIVEVASAEQCYILFRHGVGSPCLYATPHCCYFFDYVTKSIYKTNRLSAALIIKRDGEKANIQLGPLISESSTNVLIDSFSLVAGSALEIRRTFDPATRTLIVTTENSRFLIKDNSASPNSGVVHRLELSSKSGYLFSVDDIVYDGEPFIKLSAVNLESADSSGFKIVDRDIESTLKAWRLPEVEDGASDADRKSIVKLFMGLSRN